jgi:hypothetical protein
VQYQRRELKTMLRSQEKALPSATPAPRTANDMQQDKAQVQHQRYMQQTKQQK